MEHLQYPIGRFSAQTNYTAKEIQALITTMERSPERYHTLLLPLTEQELAKTYRSGSWTVRQLLHHVADVHMLNFLRIKKTLTEENYIATTIEMNAWALTSDSLTAPVDYSLLMLEGINKRFVYVVKSMSEEDFSKSYYHPVRQMQFDLRQAVHMAVWHLEHHQAHIELALGLTPHKFNLEQVAETIN
ncbi:putative metal-dependent hydrolase [Rhodocytophaga rosea]|uniref:Putative metal-dependent hydrolase n=1 Tax=Rhodocytophaga rosea TaxID=2704465 RepID=A0A6C0GLU7_9BACT|nr:putative metal-dependent hydrolase [Rhodocytophaga rosea]QHT68610.1 putative metal-dependent hydrolase [Rhodocytophaga rosea]